MGEPQLHHLMSAEKMLAPNDVSIIIFLITMNKQLCPNAVGLNSHIITQANLYIQPESLWKAWLEPLITCCFHHARDIHSDTFLTLEFLLYVSLYDLSECWCENRLTESACHMVKQERQQTEGHVAYEHMHSYTLNLPLRQTCVPHTYHNNKSDQDSWSTCPWMKLTLSHMPLGLSWWCQKYHHPLRVCYLFLYLARSSKTNCCFNGYLHTTL